MSVPGLIPFGSLVLETPALQSSQWYAYLETYLQDAGGFALVGLVIWTIAALIRSMTPQGRQAGSGVPLLVLVAVALSVGLYVAGGAGFMISAFSQSRDGAAQAPGPFGYQLDARGKWWNHCMTIGGSLALLGVVVPFLLDSSKLRFRRIWALARLSFTEAVRRRVLWVFLVFLLLFLFPPKWFFPIKPEDEISSNIALIHAGTTPLLLLAAGLLASFSIPTDIRNQTIHTIVTKPVERFEIVVGRFLGFMGLMSVVMFAVFAFALIMIAMSRVDPDAEAESKKARVPLYGELIFRGPNQGYKGDSVGREWEYRSYIAGGANSPYRAVWYFQDRDLDKGLAKLPVVTCEFSFDIFRTTKGEENKGVFCTFFVFAHQTGGKNMTKEFKERTQGFSDKARPDGNEVEQLDWERLDKIAGEMGYYEFTGKEITDYHTQSIPIPPGLFAKAMEGDPSGPRVIVAVRCDSSNQYLGVAKNDLYLLTKERSFYVNFFKGTFGIWLRLALVVGIAVTCSTYLNGVVSFLATAFLITLGYFRPFLIGFIVPVFGGDVANTANPGPADSFRKLLSNESLGQLPDKANPAHQVASVMDEVFRWCLRRIFNVVPNLERLDWEQYVAKGFDVPIEDLTLNFLFVAGYLALWAVLAHYLIKWREVATW